jgi:acetoacetyl-CoA synthetase
MTLDVREASEGALLYVPSEAAREQSRMADFARFVERERGVRLDGYEALWRWSVEDVGAFWALVARYFGVRFESKPEHALIGAMPNAHFFPGATLNYAEHALSSQHTGLALVFRDEAGERVELTREELRTLVSRCRTGLVRLGVTRGDRVAALLPNRPETLALFLACASLGAIWSSCSPEFGVGSVLDRFRQIEPKVFVAVDGYRYGGRIFDRAGEVSRIRAGLSGLSATVVLSAGGTPIAGEGVVSFAEFTRETTELRFEPVPFEHPLWILYSSGTTGLPKAIVQGHGGILLEHLKALALHSDLGPGDRFFWYTTTGWMMWNYLVSGLAVGATLVLYDGNPAHPDFSALFRLAEEEAITYFGTSAPFLIACMKNGIVPRERHDLRRIRALGTTGAPLPADGFAWVYSAVGQELLLGSVSGGTDVCTAFVLSCPLLPVHAGEIQCRGLGAKVEAFDEGGRSLVGEVGELVLTQPMPSMPVSFWGDPDGVRLRESYFSSYEGVWRHGDWVKITERGSVVIYGRSDSTLNRGGVRMGTSEFYRVVEGMPEIADSLVVDTSSLDGDALGTLWLFVVLSEGVALDAALKTRVKDVLRRELSPRHVPDRIVAIAEVPRTLNGKKLEVPVKRILLGTPPEKAASRDTLKNPAALDPFVALAGATGAE